MFSVMNCKVIAELQVIEMLCDALSCLAGCPTYSTGPVRSEWSSDQAPMSWKLRISWFLDGLVLVWVRMTSYSISTHVYIYIHIKLYFLIFMLLFCTYHRNIRTLRSQPTPEIIRFNCNSGLGNDEHPWGKPVGFPWILQTWPYGWVYVLQYTQSMIAPAESWDHVGPHVNFFHMSLQVTLVWFPLAGPRGAPTVFS